MSRLWLKRFLWIIFVYVRKISLTSDYCNKYVMFDWLLNGSMIQAQDGDLQGSWTEPLFPLNKVWTECDGSLEPCEVQLMTTEQTEDPSMTSGHDGSTLWSANHFSSAPV